MAESNEEPESEQDPKDLGPAFVHLRCHSHYSLLSAPARISGLVEKAKADGQTALALTDSSNLFGAIEFYKACTNAGIKPILGMITQLAARSRHEKTSAANPNQQLTLIARNNEGWENLRKLSSLGYLEGFHFRPRIDGEALREHRDGLLCLTGDDTGEIPRLLMAGDEEAAAESLSTLRDTFGEENVYIEVLETGVDSQRRLNPLLIAFADKHDAPLVATNDVHYLEQADWIAQDIMLCIRNSKSINDPQRYRMPSRELYLKSREQMSSLFKARPDAIENTQKLADRCEVEIEFNVYHLPIFETGSDETPDELFERLCYEGAVKRYGEITEQVKDRLDMEIGVIRQLGFSSYFLITADFIEYARKEGIPVGPGRGSAAGSIVAYVLWITNLDPLTYDLIFERFLNVARVSMPDIDVDFCGNRRDEVIDYVRDKYGRECVSQIVTFGTMASRGVLRDVGRVLEVPLDVIDKIAKKVPQGPGASLRGALESDADLQAIRKESKANESLFNYGLKLEGLARHASVHAAGVVVADRPLADYVPLCRNGDDVVAQWQMTELEEVGLLKVDFLGLKTLTILTEACRLIRDVHGDEIDLDELPLDDPKTFELMTRGDTLGVFQLESSGMRELLSGLKPDTFGDVIAVLALYRPGPLSSGMVNMFVRRKHGEEKVEYPHEDLREVLEDSYGVIVYQEQVMRISATISGFSMSEADQLRKAMGKKKPEVMAKFKQKFVDGATDRGHDAKMATNLFETIEFFAGYGFNKSHSAAYALVTYQTAWLKAHYPVEFIAANMTVESANSDKLREYVDEARRKQYEILPPSLNHSERRFTVENGQIRFGLGAVKGVGERFADQAAEECQKNGPYGSLEDFCSRQDAQLLNKGALEALTNAGAFDEIEPSRRATFDGLDPAIRTAARERADRLRGQGSLFDLTAPPPTPQSSNGQTKVLEWPESERLLREKTALGFYLSGHPFEKRGRFLARLAGHQSSDLADLGPGEEVRIAGMISAAREIIIKNGRNAGKKMGRFLLEDLEGNLEVVVFARAYEVMRDKIADDSIVIVRGRVDRKDENAENDTPGILCDEIEEARSAIAREVDALVLRLDAAATSPESLDELGEIALRHRGEHRLAFELESDGAIHRIRADRRFAVDLSDELIDELAERLNPSALNFTRR
ncbi:MAG: DNA polymerase III subunit alpha [Planctomycetota bacterium]